MSQLKLSNFVQANLLTLPESRASKKLPSYCKRFASLFFYGSLAKERHKLCHATKADEKICIFDTKEQNNAEADAQFVVLQNRASHMTCASTLNGLLAALIHVVVAGLRPSAIYFWLLLRLN